MTTRKYNSVGITSKGPSKNDVDYNVIVNTIPHVSDYLSDSVLIVSDIKYMHHVGSSYYNTYDLNIDPITNNINGDITYTSLNPTIATIDEYGITTRIADGTANILISHPWLKRKESLDHTMYYSEVVDTFDSWYSDSLAYACYTNANTRLSDANAGIAKKIYSIQNHASSIYVRNSDFWASDLDISCVSPYNTTSSVYRAGTLISPRHIIMANHYAQSVGKSIRFVDMDCNVYNRTLTAVTQIGSTDIAIGCLNSVISDVSFAKVLPENINNYLPNLNLGIPVLYTDQEEKGLVASLYSLGNYASYKKPTGYMSDFYEKPVVGDSGNPCFLIINDEPVLVSCWFTAVSGQSVSYYFSDINNVMWNMSSDYKLTSIDLSSFPIY